MAIDTLRLAQGNNLSDTLSSSIGATDLTIPVNTISIWSSTGGKVIIDRGLSTEEIIYCTGISGSSLVVQSGGRGLENTTAQGHNVGATVESVPTAGDWSDLVTAIKNVLTTSTGTLDTTKVVDLTTSQTLTNKVLTDSTNNIMAKSLKSATTTVDVSAATAPTSGQVLTATDSTHATWQTTTVSTPVRARVYNSASQSLTSGATTTINVWDTTVYDNNSFFSSSNKDRLTVAKAGVYLVRAQLSFASNSSGKRQAWFIKNGVNTGTGLAYASLPPVGSDRTTLQIAATIECSANDYLGVQVAQDSGGALNLEGAAGDAYYESHFEVCYLGPLT